MRPGGRKVRTDDPRSLPPGATALLAATLRGGQTQSWRLVRFATGWRADLRWAGQARAMAAQEQALEPVGSPEWVACQLTVALLRLDRQQAAALILPGPISAWRSSGLRISWNLPAICWGWRWRCRWRVMPQPWLPLLLR